MEMGGEQNRVGGEGGGFFLKTLQVVDANIPWPRILIAQSCRGVE